MYGDVTMKLTFYIQCPPPKTKNKTKQTPKTERTRRKMTMSPRFQSSPVEKHDSAGTQSAKSLVHGLRCFGLSS